MKRRYDIVSEAGRSACRFCESYRADLVADTEDRIGLEHRGIEILAPRTAPETHACSVLIGIAEAGDPPPIGASSRGSRTVLRPRR